MPLGVDVVAVRLGDQSAIRWPSGKTGWEVANSCHTESQQMMRRILRGAKCAKPKEPWAL